MEVFAARLKTIFDSLKNTNLVKNEDVSDVSIEQFVTKLNASIPLTEGEESAGELIRLFIKKGRSQFTNFINSTDLGYMVLLSDGGTIANALGIRGLVDIHWDKQSNKFNVKKPADAYDIVNSDNPPRVRRARTYKNPPRGRGSNPPSRRYRENIEPVSDNACEQILAALSKVVVTDDTHLRRSVSADTPMVRSSDRWADYSEE